MHTETTADSGGTNDQRAADQRASGSAFVRAEGVHKTYRTGARPVEALRGAELEITEPGFYAIMGASGSGKSTLLYLLAGLDTPDSWHH
ncbi:MAG: ATP-binding cassette domain-containing protein [Phycisphaerales bacterium]